MHFLDRKSFHFYSNFTPMINGILLHFDSNFTPIINGILGNKFQWNLNQNAKIFFMYNMSGHLLRAKPLSEPMMTQWNDMYMHNQASVNPIWCLFSVTTLSPQRNLAPLTSLRQWLCKYWNGNRPDNYFRYSDPLEPVVFADNKKGTQIQRHFVLKQIIVNGES